HNSISGWQALASSFRAAGLCISSVQPLSIERKQRPRAMTSEAINTCLVFVARKAKTSPKVARANELLSEFQRLPLKTLSNGLRSVGWHDRDIGTALFGQVVGL